MKREAKGKHNILFITCDQRMFQPVQAEGFHQPAIDRLVAQGVTFANHYISSAVCTPSRGVLYSGLPPQTTGIQEEMMFGWTPSLSPDAISIGKAMQKLKYSTAYFGKFELDRDIVFPEPDKNYTHALKNYGFDYWQPYGEVTGTKDGGYVMDGVIGAEGTSWLRSNAVNAKSNGDPWFMVLSFINPHDIFFADVNPPEPEKQVQQGLDGEIAKIPKDTQFDKKWRFPLWDTLDEPLRIKGRPEAHSEFYEGTVGVMGEIPIQRRDMWYTYNNYYLNLMRLNDQCIGQVLDTLDELDLWKDTIVVFTSDHGEIGGAHGGLRNKGPVSYEQNIHVPMIVVHPDVRGGQTTKALTSHIDVLPTLVGLTGVSREDAAEITRGLPGKDFSTLLSNPANAQFDAVRPGVLFNYVGLSTIDADFFTDIFEKMIKNGGGFAMKPEDLKDDHPDLNKRGFVSVIYNGRYKYARYYAPSKFITPKTVDDILKWNDVELFDLQLDPKEKINLALPLVNNEPMTPEDKKKLEALILDMNDQLNKLMECEGIKNDGQFLPPAVRPESSV